MSEPEPDEPDPDPDVVEPDPELLDPEESVPDGDCVVEPDDPDGPLEELGP
ncbi:MAG TPA: hypothetical protein VF660_00210 [Actinomycetota bacterium]